MSNAPEQYNLIPAKNSDGSDTGYYTREPDGVSGMSIQALADFVGLDRSTVSKLLDRIRDSDPVTNGLSDPLKPFAGKDLRLVTNDPQGRTLIVDEVCQSVTEHYALDARDYAGKSAAVANYRLIARAGMKVFIWSRTGFVPQELRASLRGNTTVYIDRLENVRDHTVAYDCWTTFREGSEVLLLIEKDMKIPVDQMDLCDGSIGRRWSDYRQGKPWKGDDNRTYIHRFQDQRGERKCRAYEFQELPHFRRWLREEYIPHHLPDYLVNKYGKRATLKVYEEIGGVSERVADLTKIKRGSEAETQKYNKFLADRQQFGMTSGIRPRFSDNP